MNLFITPNCLKGMDPAEQRAIFKAACAKSPLLKRRRGLTSLAVPAIIIVLFFGGSKLLIPLIGVSWFMAVFFVAIFALEEIRGHFFLLPLLEDALKAHPELLPEATKG